MDDYTAGALHDAAKLWAELHRKIRLDVLEALEPGMEPQHNQQIPLNPHELDALIEAVQAAHAYYTSSWNGESEDRFAAALAKFDWDDAA